MAPERPRHLSETEYDLATEWITQAADGYFAATPQRQRFIGRRLAEEIAVVTHPVLLYEFVSVAAEVNSGEPVIPMIKRIDENSLPQKLPFDSFTPGVSLVAKHSRDDEAVSGTLKRWFNDKAFPAHMKGQVYTGIVAAEPEILPLTLPAFLQVVMVEPRIRADFVFANIIKKAGKKIFAEAVKSLSGKSLEDFDKICGRYGMNVLIGELMQT